MKKCFVSLVVILIVVGSTSAATVAFDHEWTCSWNPNLLESGAALTGILGSGTATYNYTGGSWNQDIPTAAVTRYVDSTATSWTDAVGNLMEFRLRINSQPTATVDVFEAQIFHQTTGNAWEMRGFSFGDGYIVESSSSARENQGNIIAFDTKSAFVTYQLKYTSANTAILSYLNGSVWTPLLTSSVGRTFASSLADRFRIGDAQTWNGRGNWSLDYIAWNTVPEPATLSIIGLGILGLIRRKHN